MTSGNAFLIGIIGSGPIGLECGLRALQYGYRFVIFESGDDIASNVRSWSHVRLFTPLSMNMSPLGRAHVQTDNDDNAYLSGNEYIERYLRPLSCHLQSNIRLHHQVISVGRHHTNGFVILVKNGQTSREEYIFVDYVIDASGTYGCPNFAGPGKLPAINERSLRLAALPLISYRVPSERDEYLPGKRIVLIGKGDSAATSVVFLGERMF
jgi:cation diffusion facilitator CzcD-associated flavoprotein CzcO